MFIKHLFFALSHPRDIGTMKIVHSLLEGWGFFLHMTCDGLSDIWVICAINDSLYSTLGRLKKLFFVLKRSFILTSTNRLIVIIPQTMNGQYLSFRQITVSYAYKKDTKGERHGTPAGYNANIN